jgi:acyl carrier protein
MKNKKEILGFLERYFREELSQPAFNQDLKIEEIDGLDSLEIINLSMALEDKFGLEVKKEYFKKDMTFRQIIDLIVKNP